MLGAVSGPYYGPGRCRFYHGHFSGARCDQSGGSDEAVGSSLKETLS